MQEQKKRITIPLDVSLYNGMMDAYAKFLMAHKYVSFSSFIAEKLKEAVMR